MATKKPVVKKLEEPKVEEAVQIEPEVQTEKEVRQEIEELVLMGRDAPMTDEIYGIKKHIPDEAPSVLPEPNGQIQGVIDPLQRFINLYQPGEFVMRQNFRNHLLQILEDWREQYNPKEEHNHD